MYRRHVCLRARVCKCMNNSVLMMMLRMGADVNHLTPAKTGGAVASIMITSVMTDVNVVMMMSRLCQVLNAFIVAIRILAISFPRLPMHVRFPPHLPPCVPALNTPNGVALCSLAQLLLKQALVRPVHYCVPMDKGL